MLRRVNEEWGTAVVLAEHRLERCLAAADRVIALEDGAVTIDADPRGFLEQAPPALQTPGARLFAAAGLSAAAGRREGRAGRAARPRPGRRWAGERAAPPRRLRAGGSAAAPKAPVALAFERVWFEIPRGPAVLSGVDLALAPGERVALMGRNGAGKSTLLRLAAGLREPTRGRIARGGRVSLLLQHPGDYLVAERVGDELPPDALAAAGLGALADRHPRDLSGGERQRLALAIVLEGEPPAVVCLDEPTRGMDRGHKDVARRPPARARRARQRGARRHPRRGVRRPVVGAHGPARRRRARRRRPDERGPRRRLVLRHPDRAHPRRRRAAARGGSRAAPAAAAAGGTARRGSSAADRPLGGRPMSWLAASLVVLGLALVAGFAWYERSHPTARVLALVATLAALAALGRIAFAPLPNVKPTTDIVLLTGYALGGAPGFAVGAVAALASNVFFGQGPWTPWQMCAWGGVGVGGALLARAAGRELGRAGLAVACAVAGAAYGVVMNLHLWVTYSGDHSLAKLGAYFATSLPFDLAHVVGNVLFCLLFGPALVRALTPLPAALRGHLAPRAGARRRPRSPRSCCSRRRRGRPQAATPLALARERPEPRRRLRRRRAASARPASTRAGPGSASRRRGATRATSQRGGSDIVAYVRAHPPSRSADIGDTTRTILLLRAPRASRRASAAATSSRSCSPSAGAAAPSPTASTRPSFAIFALRAAGRSRNDRAVRSAARWIASQANDDGGFNFAGKGGGSGIDDTGAALQGLVAAGRRGTPTVRRAARFVVRRQNPDGGFPLQPGGPSNAQSTAWAIQGLVAAGRNPARLRRNGARSPLAYLRSLVTPSGAVRYSRTSAQTPVWVTAQALAALARKPFPLAPVPRAKRAAPAAVPRRRAEAGPRATGRSRPRRQPSARRRAARREARRPGGRPAGGPRPPDARRSGPRACSRGAHVAGYLAGALVAPVT